MSGDDYPSDDDKSFVSAKSSHNVKKESRFSPEEEAVCRRHCHLVYPVLTSQVIITRVKQAEGRGQLALRSRLFRRSCTDIRPRPIILSQLPRIRHRCTALQHCRLPHQVGTVERSHRQCHQKYRLTGTNRPSTETEGPERLQQSHTTVPVRRGRD